MGVCYTYLLYDDFDWGYVDTTKEDTIEALKKELPVAEVKAQWNNYIVVDLDKNHPWGDNAQKLRNYCDGAWYYGDSSEWDLNKVEFKKDLIKEANEPKNRNAKHIKEAFEDWKRRYIDDCKRIN